MSKKKLSFDDKKRKLLEIFHGNYQSDDGATFPDFWTLKELEKMGPKYKGIVGNTVKDVLDSLVSDGLVVCEKIGTSNYFWSFPNHVQRRRKLGELEAELQQAKEKKEEMEEAIARAQSERMDSDERTGLLRQVKEAEELNASLKKELAQYKDCDPVMLELLVKAGKIAEEAANRWTDNIYSLQSYCSNNFNMSSSDFCRQFNIPEDI